MTQTQFAPQKPNRTDFDLGLVFADQRTGDLRKVVYADDRVVLVRDETGHSTLVPRRTFLADLDARYRRRPAATPDVDGGPFDRLRDRLAEYEAAEGRKAKHKADALREALGLAGGGTDPVESSPDGRVTDGRLPGNGVDEETAPSELALEDVDGVGPATAARLRERGYVTAADVRTADDDALLAVAGVGPGTLAALREFVA